MLPAFWDLSVIDGHLYSIPQNYETMEILYNARLFKEHGWTDPKTIETIDELFALSEQIEKDGFEPHTAGNSTWRGTNEWFVTIWLDNVAGVDNVHKALTGELPWTAEPFQEAITSLKNYFQNYFNKSYYAISGDDARYALVEGRSPMYFAGTWEFGILKQFAAEIGVDEWDWAPFPNKFADRYPIFSLGVGGTFSINKDSKVADECAEFLNYLLSDKSLNRRMAEVWPGEWNFPVNIIMQEDYGDNIDKRFSNHLAVASKALDTGRFGFTTWAFYPQATMVYIIEGIEQVWSDQITVEQYLERVNEIFQQEFAEGKVPVAPKPTLEFSRHSAVTQRANDRRLLVSLALCCFNNLACMACRASGLVAISGRSIVLCSLPA